MTARSIALSAALLLTTTIAAQADAFNRIASFPVTENLGEGDDPATETSPEIIAASDDGMTLYYTDSPRGGVGIVDITDPAAPAAGGFISTDGEPTSLVVRGNDVYVGINTSESFVEPSGRVALIVSGEAETSDFCVLPGQPDAVALSPDGSFLAIAIENERDEDLNDGVIPQLPAGTVSIIPIGNNGALDCDNGVNADLTGLADVAPTDPEPEFVDINALGETVVTLQENNHIAVVARDGSIVSHFSAGEVTLTGVDTEEEGALTFDGELTVKREPDAVKWLDDDHFVIANEGDYEGGSRGFTIFDKSGEVVYDSGLGFEYAVAGAGHYPEARSANKGAEPEGLAVGTFNGVQYIFVLSERGSVVGVYADFERQPQLAQLLPSGVGPEGAVAIPSRNLFATANEADLGEDGGPRAHVMIYEFTEGATPSYPTIRSDTGLDVPLGWGALSGMVADPETPQRLFAVNDSFYGLQPRIYEIDATTKPARITRAIPVTRGGAAAQKLDLEGITTDGEGGFWLASEGRTDRLIPHALYHVNAAGEIESEVPFPAELLAVERRFGSEGVTRIEDTLWIAIQREWQDDDDGFAKLLAYDTETEEWGAVLYPLETPGRGWIGLSEITAHGDHLYIVERDNQIGESAEVKRLYRVSLAGLEAAALGGELPTVEKELVHDFLPDLKSFGGYVVDKVEGFAIDSAGEAFVVTDNDGTDDSSGETFFWSIGPIEN